ncbi:hypothetical protein SUGI_1338420, partial [Cryptomeria japonica]
MATDRLSALTDEFLSTHILSEFSYRNVVRLCLLSKRWRFLWKKITFLNFYWQDFEKQKDFEINVIISNALFHLDALFHLQIVLNGPKTADLNNWIRLAAEKKVESMSLQICYRDFSMVDLGESLFRCKNLTVLKLKSINLPKVPSNFGGFQSLKTFYVFDNPNLDDATLQEFMNMCPHLQILSIRGCVGLKKLKIRASNLICVHLGFLNPNISLQMACPQLTQINLMDYGYCRGLKLLQDISRKESVKIITLHNYGTNVVNPDIPSIVVLNSFPQLEELIIHGHCFQ